MDLVAAVVTPAAVIVAVAAGFASGFVLIGEVITGGKYGFPAHSAFAYAQLVTRLAIVFVGVFYVGQIVSSIVDGDPSWPRIAARFVLWIVYAFAAGAGVWLAVRRHS